MTFDLAKLTALSNDENVSTWSYDTGDDVRDLAAPGYFNDIRRMLRRGDLIFASCLHSGVRRTTPFLVCSMPDEPTRAEPMLAPAADGELGAIPISEKAQPNGVATLDATGRVPLAQMPSSFTGGQISTCEMFYAAEARFAGGLRAGNPAAANDAALDALFAALRASAAERKYVEFPPGTFDIGASIAPSGKTVGRGEPVGLMTTFAFKNCAFVVNGEAADYTPMTLEDGGIWSTLTHFSIPADGMRTYGLGTDLFDTAGHARSKHVVFDIRNCGGLSCLGRLALLRRGPRIPHLVAFGSSGGDREAFSCSGMDAGSVAHLTIENFAVGMMALQLSSSSERISGTWSSVGFQDLAFVSCGRCLVIEADHCTGMNVDRLALMGDQTSYLSGVHAITVGSCVLTCNGATPLPGQLSFKLLEVSDAEINLATVYGRATRHRGGFSLINVGHSALVRIGTVHYENRADSELQSGCLFTMVSGNNGQSCTQASLQIGATGYQLEKNPGLTALVGITANSAGAKRQIWANVFDPADDALAAVRVIRDFGAAALGTATTSDRIHGYSAGGGFRVQRLVNGALTEW